MIGWGASSVCMTGLVPMSGIFLEIKRSLKEWRMHEFPMSSYFCRDANTYRVESRKNRRQLVRQPQLPPWCPEGLTRTQKRRLQHERREELSKGESSAKSKDRQQPDPKGKGPSANVNMVFMLLMEFLAPASDDEVDFFRPYSSVGSGSDDGYL